MLIDTNMSTARILEPLNEEIQHIRQLEESDAGCPKFNFQVCDYCYCYCYCCYCCNYCYYYNIYNSIKLITTTTTVFITILLSYSIPFPYYSPTVIPIP
jgi:hypothetical protein